MFFVCACVRIFLQTICQVIDRDEDVKKTRSSIEGGVQNAATRLQEYVMTWDEWVSPYTCAWNHSVCKLLQIQDHLDSTERCVLSSMASPGPSSVRLWSSHHTVHWVKQQGSECRHYQQCGVYSLGLLSAQVLHHCSLWWVAEQVPQSPFRSGLHKT